MTAAVSIEAMLSQTMTPTMFRQLCDPGAELQDGTIKSYLATARRILSEIYSVDISMFTLPLLLNSEKITSYVEDDTKVPSLHSKKAMYVVCSKLLSNFQHTPPDVLRYYKDQVEKTRERIDAALVLQQPTESEARCFEMLAGLPGRVAELLDAFEKTSENDVRKRIDLYQMYLVANLYSGLHEGFVPVRSEMAEVFVCGRGDIGPLPTSDPRRNYLVMGEEESYFMMNNFKTVRSHGPLRLQIPDSLKPIVAKWLEINTSPHLLIVPTTVVEGSPPRPMSRSYLSRYIAKAMTGDARNKVGSRLMRKHYVTTRFGADMQERLDVAQKMGHSVAIAMAHYSKKRRVAG